VENTGWKNGSYGNGISSKSRLLLAPQEPGDFHWTTRQHIPQVRKIPGPTQLSMRFIISQKLILIRIRPRSLNNNGSRSIGNDRQLFVASPVAS
jgi:hypothetical protein